MPQVLRVLSLGVVAIWFGATVFVTFGAGPALFSPEVQQLVPRYHAGRIAQVILQSFFWFQIGCSIAAVLLLLAGWAYAGRPPRKWASGLLLALVALVLLGGLSLQPKLRNLHSVMYAPDTSLEDKTVSTQRFRRWHGVSQIGNLLVLIGVGVYFVHLTIPVGPRPASKYPVAYY